MKRKILKSSLCAGLIALGFCIADFRTGKLTDITKPHLGEYECESATLSGEELLDEFSYIRLELKENGVCTLYYCKKDGKKREETGKYTYDEKREEICLYGGVGKTFKRKFPLKNGKMDVTVRLGDKTLSMRFVQK